MFQGCNKAPVYDKRDEKVVGFCSYSEAFDNMYVCLKIKSVFDAFIDENIQRTVSGVTCNIPPPAPEPLRIDESQGPVRRLERQPSCGFPFFNRK